jgi:capsular polysaccharide biosynthesis protein
MSLSDDTIDKDISLTIEVNKIYTDYPLFHFVYNTDNYYHFIYDTLPYLISYFELKKNISNLKLLMNYPNFQKNKFYKFVQEFLEIIGIKNDDIVIIQKNTLYSEIYFSSSFTHGQDSNLPPRKEIYEFYKKFSEKIKNDGNIKLPKKIYVSRRTWLNEDHSNIGTNYTQKRKLESENELVEFLVVEGFDEIFTENLSTFEKLIMFMNVEVVVGSIGGGISNVLFSNPNCKLIAICSPTFLEVNERFKYSFTNVDTYYFTETFHVEKDHWKKWMRVRSGGIIGEIEEVYENDLLVSHTEKILAGWNNEIEYNKTIISKQNCKSLDKGLNSSWDLKIENSL